MQEGVKVNTIKIDLLGLLCVVVLASVTAYTTVGKALIQVSGLSEEERRLNDRMSELNVVSATLADGEQVLRAIQENIALLDSLLPERIQFSAFYRTLAETATKYRLELVETQPGEVRDRENCIEMWVRIRVKGSFKDFYGFLFEVTTLSRLTKVQHLSIKALDPPSLCDVNMTVCIYGARPAEVDHGGG